MALKSLATLIQLQKTYVDEQRVLLARLQGELDRIDGEIAAFKEQKKREAEVARVQEASRTYGAFVKLMIARERELIKERGAAAQAVKIAQDKLSELFEEQKRYEIAEENRLAELAREELRQENKELDEIGGVMHERQRKD